jgi:hypothetical protein
MIYAIGAHDIARLENFGEGIWQKWFLYPEIRDLI